MKKIISVLLAAIIAAFAIVPLAGCSNNQPKVEFVKTEYEGTKLYVYNWGENIANGEDDSLDLVKVFETKYGIDVIYSTYPSNEEMYTKLTSGTDCYDLIIPSDYMIARLKSEGLLQKINYSNIPNYQNLEEQYRVGMYYDCGGSNGAAEYSVPYTVGMVGVVYNTKYVDEADAKEQSWGLLWNQKYSGKILMINNSRDTFAVSMLYKGLDINSANEADWNTAYDALVEQKPLLKGYVMDEIYNSMEGENAYVGVYYAGDCLTMIDENENLSFYYPKEGTNIFVDAMCIPKNAKNPGAAELFINFLLEEEYAIENSLYIRYASPNTKVINSAEYKSELGGDYYDILYGIPDCYKTEDGKLNSKIVQYYDDLDSATKAIQSKLWGKLK